MAVLSNPTATVNQYLYIESFTASQNEILAALESGTGEKWTVTESNTEVAVTEGQALFDKGDFAGLLLLLKANFLGEGYGTDYTEDAKLSNEFLGLPNQDLASTVKAIVAGEAI